MPQTAQTISSDVDSEPAMPGVNAKKSDNSAVEDFPVDTQLSSVMSDLNQLSQSFVNSYQNLEGKVEQLNGQMQNISEQRSEAIEEQQKLLDEKQTITNRLQNLLAILPSGVVVLDGKGIVRDCNAVAIDILGRPLLGESWLSVINRTFLPQANDGHQISLKDGRIVHIETRALDSEPGQMIVLTDMTKTRKLQAKLSQQQKLSSMGNMIASLAHQIRTPLSAAILYGSHINSNNINERKKQQFSESLLERLRYMDRQISDMLSFVKGERIAKKSILLCEFIQRIKSLCCIPDTNVILNSRIETVEESKRYIIADIDSLMGAIENLLNNAIEATENKNSPVEIVIFANTRISIQIVNQGKGVPIEFREKIFEPFYTTKSNGNGLGLAIVHGVVIDHAGTIKVLQNSNKTTFEISFPIFEYPQNKKSEDDTNSTDRSITFKSEVEAQVNASEVESYGS